MTNLTLMEYGIGRDTIALMNLPLLVVHILVPLCMSGITHPFLWFARGYIPRLFAGIFLATYIFFTPQLLHTSYYYPLLIVFICLNETFVYIITVSRIGIYARVSEPRIASTYMTLLAAISNLGQNLSSTSVLYISNWLPKLYEYSIEVCICFILGFIWIGLMWKRMTRLNALPCQEWHLKPTFNISIPSSTMNSQATIIENNAHAI
ncbi:hypothetical protein I4U23_015214 [Adineta vaga]|nr:hypothetical protein I4U23_015214 [Adineta vaga]